MTRRLLLVAPVIGALALLAACSGGAGRATGTAQVSDVTVQGQITLHGYAEWYASEGDGAPDGSIAWVDVRQGAPCSGKGGYDDIAQGMQVLLSDGTQTLDVGSLSAGSFGPVAEHGVLATPQTCVFSFTLHVPAGHKFYTVAPGHRGTFTYSYAQITASGALDYALGN